MAFQQILKFVNRERISLGYLASLGYTCKQYATKHTVYSLYCIYSVHSNVEGASNITGDYTYKIQIQSFFVSHETGIYSVLGNADKNKLNHNIFSDGLLYFTTSDIPGSSITYFWDRVEIND